MNDLIATAKCGLLDSIFLGTFWLPLMPTVVAVTAFVLAHGTGRLLAHSLAIRPIRHCSIGAAARASLAAAVAILLAVVALRGIAYPLFLARMVKDAYFCSYFEVGRDLEAVHFVVFGMMFAAQVSSVVLYDDRHFRKLASWWFKAAWFGAYASLGILGYVMAVALDETLAPLTILFVLPFAYCGIGTLARQR